MDLKVKFPGGLAVNADYGPFNIETNQDGTAPPPFALLLASIGTCAGIYVVYFCQERGIDTSKIKMKLEFDRDEKKNLTTAVHMHIDLPADFPPKYKKAAIKAAKLCTVKRNIADPPEFNISATIQGE